MSLPSVSGEFRLAYDPELKFLPSGTAALRLRLVASRRRKDDSGEWVEDKTCFVSAYAYGKVAENAAESIVKGDLVEVRGQLVTEQWTDRSGTDRSELRLLVDGIGPSMRFRVTPHGGKAAIEAAQEAGELPAGSQYQREGSGPRERQPVGDSTPSRAAAPAQEEPDYDSEPPPF